MRDMSPGRGGACRVLPGCALPCSGSAFLGAPWCSPPGPALGCGLSIVEALLPVLAARQPSPFHRVLATRNTGWSCSVYLALRKCQLLTYKGH